MISQLLQQSISFVPWKWRSRIKDVPLIASFQRRLINQFLNEQKFLHTINAGPACGLSYPVHLPQDKSIWIGTYEVEFATALAEAVTPGDVCYDIGGFRGFFSAVLALAGAKNVYIFEPLPDNCQQIRAVMAANPNLLSMSLQNIAVGDQKGEAEFLVMPEASMGKLSASSFQVNAQENEKITVQIDTLDNLVQSGQLEKPNLIKIDVEGAEILVLHGAIDTLQKCKPQLFIEIHSRELAHECNLLLTSIGYNVTVMETHKKPDFVTEPEVCHFLAK
ncbi:MULTISPECIES: FkbM family methyltransferase [Calothrix]|uniref:FkbM family methyltransferase n=2 Tax=Calothrix TaxID=1186 RepID=A0ABR8A1U2_9CYAN|nr:MULTISPECIES: FkbM family methyltransferase [Calothrix]MBD2193878.1 FkbM family methyltransferase [Calothrix parietina FACHB-288]MBD2222884.1 FkbM family methyltransferase [Calothrix anomala FACHB-343]